MIVEAILGLVHAVALTVVEQLPIQESMEPLSFSSTPIALSIVAGVFPFDLAAGIAVGMVGWMVVCHGYRIVLWLLGVLHISGDSS